jgi:hypothetical protein
VIPLPDPNVRGFTHAPQTRKPRSATAAQEAYKQVVRQRFRALALLVKAKLEAVDAGIATFEFEMLNKTMLTNDMTVEKWAEPRLRKPTY